MILTLLQNQPSPNAIIEALNPFAWFPNATGVTVTGAGVSMWADAVDTANALVLPGTGLNYAGSSVNLSPTGDIDLACRVRLVDWTPSVANALFSTRGSNSGFAFYINPATGWPTLYWGNGSAFINKSPNTAPTVSDGGWLWVRVTLDVDNGAGGNDVKVYTAADSDTIPTIWTQLGSTVTSAGTTSIATTVNAPQIGGDVTGVGVYQNGSVGRCILKDGIDGTVILDADFTAQTRGATSFTESSSNAATVTVNQSGALPAHIGSPHDYLQGTDSFRPGYSSGVITGDGVDNYLKTNAFTLAQPLTRFIVGKDVTWTLNDYICDGNAKDSAAMLQSATTPSFKASAGSAIGENNGLSVGTRGIRVIQINGASSFTQVNNGAPITGNAGAANAGGLTLLASGTTIGGFANSTAEEEVVFASALSAGDITTVVNALAQKLGISV